MKKSAHGVKLRGQIFASVVSSVVTSSAVVSSAVGASVVTSSVAGSSVGASVTGASVVAGVSGVVDKSPLLWYNHPWVSISIRIRKEESP